ncbi:MAG: metallophosphoesterase [Bacteroidales bacterium]|nr:metallophosphoesterase [Bacteroidales bacterium]
MKIGILSDIHEDVNSLSQALRMLENERCDQVISLGDIVGYDDGYYGTSRIQDANECIRLVKENCSLSLIGNHDLFAIKKLPEFNVRFDYPANWYSLSLAERQRIGRGKLWDYSHAEDQAQLSDISREYLSGLPEFVVTEFSGIKILFSHHLYPDLNGSLRKMPIWPSDIWPHLKWMKRNNCHTSITGHTHVEGTITGNWFHLHTTLETNFFIGTNRSWLTCLPVTQGGVSSGCMIFIPETGEVTIHHI